MNPCKKAVAQQDTLYLWEDLRTILCSLPTNNPVSLHLPLGCQTYPPLFPSQPRLAAFPSLLPPKCSRIIDCFPISTSLSDSVFAETGSSSIGFSPSSTAPSNLTQPEVLPAPNTACLGSSQIVAYPSQ